MTLHNNFNLSKHDLVIKFLSIKSIYFSIHSNSSLCCVVLSFQDVLEIILIADISLIFLLLTFLETSMVWGYSPDLIHISTVNTYPVVDPVVLKIPGGECAQMSKRVNCHQRLYIALLLAGESFRNRYDVWLYKFCRYICTWSFSCILVYTMTCPVEPFINIAV